MPRGPSEVLKHDAASLANLSDRVVRILDGVDTLKESMASNGIATLEFGAKGEVLRALKALEKFVRHGEGAIREYREERGDFEAGASSLHSESAKATRVVKKVKRKPRR